MEFWDDDTQYFRIESWRRPADYLVQAPVLIKRVDPQGLMTGSVVQGVLEDCYLLGALAAVATKPELLMSLFTAVDVVEGKYTLQFFKNGEWMEVHIDDRLPCGTDGQPLFATCTVPENMWVGLVEKAYAKIHGGYRCLEFGAVPDALGDLTAGVPSLVELRQDQAEKVLKELAEHLDCGGLAGASFFDPATVHSSGAEERIVATVQLGGQDEDPATLRFTADECAEEVAAVFLQEHELSTEPAAVAQIAAFVRGHQQGAKQHAEAQKALQREGGSLKRSRPNTTSKIMPNHSYTILGMTVSSDGSPAGIWIRNTWGAGALVLATAEHAEEPGGSKPDGSGSTEAGAVEEEEGGAVEEGGGGACKGGFKEEGGACNGGFKLTPAQFVRHFNALHLCTIDITRRTNSPANTAQPIQRLGRVTCSGHWGEGTAGGAPSMGNRNSGSATSSASSWHTNPQFVLQSKVQAVGRVGGAGSRESGDSSVIASTCSDAVRSCSVYIVLRVPDNRLSTKASANTSGSYMPIGFDVVEQCGEQHVFQRLHGLPQSSQSGRLFSSSVFVAARQVSLRVQVRHGRAYQIVPCTYEPGIVSDFSVDIVFDQADGEGRAWQFALSPLE
jgi:hypothetical protein